MIQRQVRLLGLVSAYLQDQMADSNGRSLLVCESQLEAQLVVWGSAMSKSVVIAIHTAKFSHQKSCLSVL
jgi:hypothetical protein